MKFEIIEINQKEIEKLGNLTEFTIEAVEVGNHEQYENLCELLKKVKGKEKEIKTFFKEPKAEAYATHKEISRLEKEMLDKLAKFETTAKVAVGEYLLKLEKARTVENPIDVPAVKGVSASDVFKFEITDENLIPNELGGVKLWIVDQKAIGELIKLTKGTLEIPGVKIIKEKQVSVRA